MLGRSTTFAALLACSSLCCRGGSAGAVKTEPPSAQGAARIFAGMCDASAAVSLSSTTVVVADDEENVLRVYDVDRGGPPLKSFDLSSLLGLPTKLRKDGSVTSRELDIGAAARIGEQAYFMTSHGRDSRGRLRTERLKFFALHPTQSGPWPLHGAVYENLLDDLFQDPRLAPYQLREASRLPAKAEGGLNIEGMTARAEGGVWLGFRNPVPQGRALLVPLLNPEAVVLGSRAQLGDPRLLDLGGRSVRALAYVRGRYLIAAGAFDAAPSAALYRWDGAGAVEELRVPGLAEHNPEALLATDDRKEILLLSDDGSSRIDGVECKKLKDPARKRFRGLWLKPDG